MPAFRGGKNHVVGARRPRVATLVAAADGEFPHHADRVTEEPYNYPVRRGGQNVALKVLAHQVDDNGPAERGVTLGMWGYVTEVRLLRRPGPVLHRLRLPLLVSRGVRRRKAARLTDLGGAANTAILITTA